ncbi:hypothetical protein SCD_n01099 [Sulfuricella denitrificans skB26]|uniref:TVP38/TMEM64 family membrane protein n=1 Tax=Sulfuricella denitrificans (strain DSM 22764 / NBRC 105220 / skB26) TaxID=1163617 RepID=S6A9Y8_SULDS|nr:TVP38/TMEM64 family protein [Sulfuricella denitrificans]BAN34935.1 hypothetical protein SCD_n01099 [Sulfuricella denitrificans skB26]
MIFPSNKKALLLLLLLLSGLTVIGFLLYTSGFVNLFLSKEHLLDFINRHRAYAAFIFIGLQAAQVVIAPVPGELTGFVGGLIFGSAWGVVYSTIGLTLGSWLAFMLARMLGRPLVERVVKAETIARYDYVMQHKGRLLAFFMFLIPGFPKDYLCYLLGLGHMRLRDFLVIVTAGRMLGTSLLTLAGSYYESQRYGLLFAVVGFGLGIMLIAIVFRDRIERWLHRFQSK